MLRASLYRTGSAWPNGLSSTGVNLITPLSLTPHLRLSSSARPRYFTISHPRLNTPSSATPVSSDVSSSLSPHPPKPGRQRGIYYAVLFLLFGAGIGSVFRITIAPPALPALGSAQDLYLQSQIQARGVALPIVQQLSADPAWTSWDAYSGIPTDPSPANPEEKSRARSRITSGAMSGSSGLTFQRIFHNASTGEVVNVIYFGPGLAGWPGVVHGGALATVLDETLGRCAILNFPSRTGVTANLELQYRAPTRTNNFYVIRTRPMDDVTGKDGTKGNSRKLWVQGTLETDKGKVTVEAKALFVVPKGYKLPPLIEGF